MKEVRKFYWVLVGLAIGMLFGAVSTAHCWDGYFNSGCKNKADCSDHFTGNAGGTQSQTQSQSVKNTNNFSPTINIAAPEPAPAPEPQPLKMTVSLSDPTPDITTVSVDASATTDPATYNTSFRQHMETVQPTIPVAPLYNGPFLNEGWNILANQGLLPSRLTDHEADLLSKVQEIKINGTTAYVCMLKEPKWGYEAVSLVMDAQEVKNIIGYIFLKDVQNPLQGHAVASTVAIQKRATKMHLANRSIDYVPSGWTAGIGGGAATSHLAGDKMQSAYTGTGTVGFSYTKGGLNKKEGLVYVLMGE